MKKINWRPKLAAAAAVSLLLSQGLSLTASAEGYRQVMIDPMHPEFGMYLYEDDPFGGMRYEPAPEPAYVPAPKRANAVSGSKKAKAAEIPINSANFPDDRFRAYISENFDKDDSGGLSDNEINNVTYINANYVGISSLKGIEYFTNLRNLYCTGNLLTSIDVNQNTALTRLDIDYNKLTSLDVSSNVALRDLNCSHNNLTSLDVSNNINLDWLSCYNNKLTQLDVSGNTALRSLQCGGNNLTTLDVSHNTDLELLGCGDNLASLDISNNVALEQLMLNSSSITHLDLSNNIALKRLQCYGNIFTSLDVSNNTSLEYLQCNGNKLTQLDISNNKALKFLDCTNNYFKSKSSIIGLNENSIDDCSYITQYYEGFEYKNFNSDIDWDTVPFPSEEDVFKYQELAFTKCISNENRYILFKNIGYDYPPSYDILYTNCVGIPEKTVTDDGIVFIPKPNTSNSPTATTSWSWKETENKIRFFGNSINFFAYEPGDYTLVNTVTYHYGNRHKTYTKEYTITAVDMKDHVHEYTEEYSNGWYNNEGGYDYKGHSRKCYCDTYYGTIDGQLHEYESELTIVPYLDGSNLYYKHCKICKCYELVNAKNSKTLKDEDSGTEVTELDENAIPDDAELYVTDVTDTEKIDPGVLKNIKEVFDIALKQGGVERQPDGKIAVTLTVPAGVNGEKAKVYRKEADGTFTDMKAVYNPQSKKLTFVTDHLSIYALTGGDGILGDVDGNGVIDLADVILLGRSFMGQNPNEYAAIADMDGDGTISLADVILLGRLFMSQA